MHKIRHLLEACVFLTAFALFRLLPLDAASWLGGALGRRFGPLPGKANRVARVNLALAFPEKSEAEREAIRLGMWEHLGRVAAEFAHLPGEKLLARVNVSGVEHLPKRQHPVQFVSGHFGNWELSYPIAHAHGVPVTLIYRHANNPYIEKFITRIRAHHADDMLPKGPRGALRLARALKRKSSLALLIDQKMNEGVPIPFFGREAMTAPAVAQFAARFAMPIITARVVRTGGAHFAATIDPPLQLPESGDAEADARALLAAINARLEGWIREHPEQWFWIHRRFEKSLY